jgi:hypothetical protein
MNTNVHSLPQLRQRVVGEQAIDLGVVFFFDVAAADGLAQAAIGGEQEQAFAKALTNWLR